ncbi:hypothetical protein [Anabaena lutea]|uniref:Uncharacterized protein n=1 Tax=Anabaena lutea FACHB-196 TaxID=2692881 RepID=A0ABR8F941_9NOST|nr:hypothetical protein [Anabaena lutea]MBD2566464.1 hypothetical protein [Anabaena lutea FACHB-196]
MSFLLEDMMLIETNENEIKEQEENLQEIAKQLEEIFRTENAAIPKEDFRKYFSKIENALRKLEKAKTNKLNSKAKSRIYEEVYKNVKNLKEKYSDFLTNELIEKFAEIEVYFGWKKEIYKLIFFSEEIVEINKHDIKKGSEKLYNIIYTMLQAIEKYTVGATQKEIDIIQHLAENLILYIENKRLNTIPVFRKTLNSAKAILWEIDRQKNQSKNTVESLLDFLKTSPEWVGDDFEECLEYVNEVRRE